MNRLTNDNPKGDIQTALNLFYIKDYETFVRGGGPGPEYADISLYDFTRQIIKANIPDVDLNIDDDSLAVMIDEWRFDGPESIEGVIALLYTAAWSFSTLRRRLAAYEDTGLEPEDVTDLLAAHGTAIGQLTEYRALGPIDHLRELVQTDQDGRLMVLPCKPGTEIFGHCHIKGAQPISHGFFYPPYIPTIGKDAWLTREEAEAALSAGRNQNTQEDQP